MPDVNQVQQVPVGLLTDLRDPVWQFIGAIVGLAAIVIMVWIAIAQRRKKSLSYVVLTHTKVVSVHSAIKKTVSIVFAGKPVDDLTLCEIRFINDGNQPITEADFAQELKLTFGEDAEVLSFEILNKKPAHLNISTSQYHNSIGFDPTLINPGDSFECKALLSGQKVNISAISRIAGVGEVKKIREGSSVKRSIYVLAGLTSSMALFAAAISTLPVPASPEPPPTRFIVFIVVAVLIYLATAVFVLRDPRFMRILIARLRKLQATDE